MKHSSPYLTDGGAAGQVKPMFAWELSQGLIQDAETVSTPEQTRPGSGGQPWAAAPQFSKTFTNTERRRHFQSLRLEFYPLGIVMFSFISFARGDNGEL